MSTHQSQHVTVTRTVTSTTSSSPIILNTGFVKSVPGILKIVELVLGIVTVALVGNKVDKYLALVNEETFFLLMAVSFLIGTFVLALSHLVSFSTAPLISKTPFEVIYHSLASILYMAASIALIIEVTQNENAYKLFTKFDTYIAASVIGMILSLVYLASTFFAAKSYREFCA